MKHFAVPAWVSLSIPVVVGAVVMSAGGAPVARWGVHVAAGLMGVASYCLLTRMRWQFPRRLSLALVLVGVLAFAATLLSPGIEGMRRWHTVGALLVHPSALLMPLLLVFAAAQLALHRSAVHLLVLGLQGVHFAQPDAGQATAVGLAMIGLLLADPLERSKAILVSLYAGTIVATWLRLDPLPPAPFVEDIVPRAFALAPAAGVAALSSLAVFVLSPLLGARGQSPMAPAVVLVCYFLGSLVGAMCGEFPVPLLGFGTSPLLGAFLGLAAYRRLQLASLRVSQSAHESPQDPKSNSDRVRLRAANPIMA